MLAKHYPGIALEELWKPEEITPFMVEHLQHHHAADAMHLDGDPGLAIVTDAAFHGASGAFVQRVLVGKPASCGAAEVA